MTGLPDTRARRPASPWRLVLPLAAAVLLLALLLAPGGDAVPRERIYSPGVEDVAVGAGGVTGRDEPRFRAGTRVVDVRVRVRDLPAGERLAAAVERTGRSSVLGRLSGAGGIRAVGGAGERLSISEGGASGVVAFEVRSSDGGALPGGAYAVEIRAQPGAAGEDRLLARAHFRVGAKEGWIFPADLVGARF